MEQNFLAFTNNEIGLGCVGGGRGGVNGMAVMWVIKARLVN